MFFTVLPLPVSHHSVCSSISCTNCRLSTTPDNSLMYFLLFLSQGVKKHSIRSKPHPTLMQPTTSDFSLTVRVGREENPWQCIQTNYMQTERNRKCFRNVSFYRFTDTQHCGFLLIYSLPTSTVSTKERKQDHLI